jgi:glyoxylase-like metal-dependent hydrolase (beta-lactamase superfamily II)
LLIDTAFNTDECEKALTMQILASGADIETTDIFVTHLHVDHCGLIARLKRSGNTIYASNTDKEYIYKHQEPNYLSEFLVLGNEWMGVPQEYELPLSGYVAQKNKASVKVPIVGLNPGDHLSYGKYDMEVINLAGHTPGQIGLWDKTRGTLFCGDHILGTISPNISAWDLDTDYVQLFCDSLRRVREMPIRQLFAAHGKPIPDANARIDELIEHHRNRLDIIERLVCHSAEPLTAFLVAKDVEWSTGKKFERLSVEQKRFACSETLAHLQSLVFSRRLAVAAKGKTLFFSTFVT